MSLKLTEFLFNVTGILLITVVVYLGVNIARETETEHDITNAEPISQQKIGDDVNPDILIIYEAEVDGETVYPTVIKEAK